METNAYEIAEAVAEEIAAGTVPGVIDMIPPDGGEDDVSFVVVLETAQRFKVSVVDITHGDAADDDDD